MLEFLRRLQYLFQRRRFDQELAEEMEAHREISSRQGTPFGNTLRLREEARDAWGWTWIDRFVQDLRYAARMLRKSPGFTAAAILMLAIGIGVNVAAFSFFNLIFLKPLPVRETDTLIRLEPRSPHDNASYMPYAEMDFVRQYSQTLSSVLASRGTRIRIEDEEKPISLRFVSANFFDELGAMPTLGQLLKPSSDNEPVAALSYEFWTTHFGADSTVVGKTLRLNGKPVTILGVVSPDFSGLDLSKTDIWMSLRQQPYIINGSRLLSSFSHDDGVDTWGRLKPGLTAKVAENEIRGLIAQLYRQHPSDLWKDEFVHAEPAGLARVEHGRWKGSEARNPRHEIYPALGLVSALVLLILAVCCGNLGSLLLARSVAREREISVRISVGAGRGRLVRQLFTESLLLALLGSLAGLGLGFGTLRTLMLWSAAPGWLKATPDWRVVAFSLAIGVLAAVLFGLTPALQLARQRHRATVLRQVLIGAQIAASCVLLIVSGLLVRALDFALHFHPGFEYKNVVLIEPALDTHGYSPERASAYLDQLQSRLRQLPGVESVALSSLPPLGGGVETTGTPIAGRQVAIHVSRVSPEFFRTMGIPILHGRALQAGDTRSLVIGESFAHLGWPNKDPVGSDFTTDTTNFKVIGIVSTARLMERENPDAVEAYFPLKIAGFPYVVVLVKTAGPPDPLLPAMNSIAKAISPDVVPYTHLLKNSFRQQLETIQSSALAVSVLGGVALVIASLGIVGLVAYSVSQRTKEIGLRMALGADPGHVLFIVLQQLGRTVLVGLLAGVAGAAALSQLLRRELYGIDNLDPLTYGSALLIFAVVSATAALLPARRALRIDPMLALRCE